MIYEIGGRLAAPLPKGTYFVSIINKIELLSFPEATPAQEKALVEFLETVTIVDLSPGIVDEAIRLRKSRRLKLPDAIVAATAIVTGSELLTHDADLLKVAGVKSSAPALK